MIGNRIMDAYCGTTRIGVVVEDLDSHWRVDWGPNKTKVRKDRVGARPKKQGPWWAEVRLGELSAEDQFAVRADNEATYIVLDDVHEYIRPVKVRRGQVVVANLATGLLHCWQPQRSVTVIRRG